MAVTLRGGMGSHAFSVTTVAGRPAAASSSPKAPVLGTYTDRYKLTRWRKKLAEVLFREGIHERIVGGVMRRAVGHNSPCVLRDVLLDAAVTEVCRLAVLIQPGRSRNTRGLFTSMVRRAVRFAQSHFLGRGRGLNVAPPFDDGGDFLDTFAERPPADPDRTFNDAEDLALKAHAKRVASLNGTVAKAVALRMEGHTFAETAATVGLDEWTVREVIHAHVRGVRQDLGLDPHPGVSS